MNKKYNMSCNIAETLDIVGDRWTLLIIRDLLLGKSKFTDLKLSLQGISPNILSERLQFLEETGIVYSRLYSSHPPRLEYFLTEKGSELKHVLVALTFWGNRFLENKYTEVVHMACGHEVEATYHCPQCNTNTKDIKTRKVIQT